MHLLKRHYLICYSNRAYMWIFPHHLTSTPICIPRLNIEAVDAGRTSKGAMKWEAVATGLLSQVTMDSEAVDAGVFWMPPIAQDTQLHHAIYVQHLGR